jgi:hypothetical protein
VDISFEDDVTVILLLGVPFMVLAYKLQTLCYFSSFLMRRRKNRTLNTGKYTVLSVLKKYMWKRHKNVKFPPAEGFKF